MSVKILGPAWRLSKAKGGDLLVLLAIADYANDEGTAWPSIPSLARKARMTTRNTQRAIRRLVARGELVIEDGKGPHRTHRYRVVLAEKPKSEGCQNVMESKSQDDICDRERVTFQPYNPSEETVIKKEIVSGDNLSPSEQQQNVFQTIDLQFEKFWECYPKRSGKRLGKPEALRKFRTIAPDDHSLVLSATKNYSSSEMVKKGIGIMDPHRFLQKSKEDQPWREWIEPETNAVAPQNKCERHLNSGSCEEYAMPGSRYCAKHKAAIVALQRTLEATANCAQ